MASIVFVLIFLSLLPSCGSTAIDNGVQGELRFQDMATNTEKPKNLQLFRVRRLALEVKGLIGM